MSTNNNAEREFLRSWLKKHVVAGQFTSLIENPPPASRLELVRLWLEDNVLRPTTPTKITLSSIKFDWEQLRGSFRLSLDNLLVPERFDLRVDIAGDPVITPPIFVSPLGAPASYAAVELDQKTDATVMTAVRRILPRMRGYGFHAEQNLTISSYSPAKDRIIDSQEYLQKRQCLEQKGYTLTLLVEA